jgi:hypothetical protein
MASVFDYLQDLLFALFSRNPQEAEKRRALRPLLDRLRQVQPRPYRRSSGHLLPAFGYSLLQLAYLLAPMADLFNRTLYGEDARMAERYRQQLAVFRLPEAKAGRLADFAFEAMRARALASDGPMKELDLIGEEFEQLLSAFAGPEFEDFDKDYAATDRLASLCRHDLSNFFDLFDPGFNPAQKTRKPSFQPVPGKKALQELLDLYFVLAGVAFSEGVESNLNILLARLERDRAAGGKERVRTILSRLDKLLGRELSPELLLTLIRVIQEDPAANPRVLSEEVPCLMAVKEELQAAFQKDRERVQREINEKSIGGDLETLLSGAEPLEVPGYNEAIGRELSFRGFDTFLRVKPLSILKSFLLAHFERGLKDRLKRLLVEGTFANRIFENMFSNAFYGCEGLLPRMRLLEDALQSGPLAAEKLARFLQLHDQGKPVAPLISKTVEALEQDVRRLVDEGASSFYNLSVIMGETLQDARQQAPALISNVKAIGGRANKEFLAGLASGLTSLQLFIKIMRNFTEIRQNPAASAPRT